MGRAADPVARSGPAAGAIRGGRISRWSVRRQTSSREIAKFKAIEGKTWNHPVIVGDVLLVRNGEEMAAFRLPLAGR